MPSSNLCELQATPWDAPGCGLLRGLCWPPFEGSPAVGISENVPAWGAEPPGSGLGSVQEKVGDVRIGRSRAGCRAGGGLAAGRTGGR